jgi:hypothetical protein
MGFLNLAGEQRQRTVGVSFARIPWRFKFDQKPSKATRFPGCATLAQRVQSPLQWKEARNFADDAI